MSTVLEIFNQKELLDYTKDRQYPAMMGEELFPEEKRQSLEFDMLISGSRTPVVASVHGFDTEAEIDEREAQKMAIELALIKRKSQLKEKEIIALESPRNEAEKKFLMREVYNDIDRLQISVKARVEQMRMELIATGKVTIKENNLDLEIDYGVPAEHKVTNVDWDSATADPVADMMVWFNKMEVKPTRVLTSNTILMKILRNLNIVSAIFGKESKRIATVGELNAYLQQLKLPAIYTYDEVYKKSKGRNQYETHRYFPENAFVMMPSGELGKTLYGPTAEEIRLTRDPSIQAEMIGNILTMVYEEGKDPVSTWKKAVATALPTCPYADELFQAEINI